MGRPREPIALVVAKGNKHLGKEEIEKRKVEEVNAPSDEIIPPAFLTTQSQKDHFYKLAYELRRIDILANIDCELLGRYIFSQDEWVKTTTKINKLMTNKNFIDNLDLIEKLSKLQDRYWKQCHNAARELGMTISSRCKLIVPKGKTEEKPINKYAKFLDEEDVC